MPMVDTSEAAMEKWAESWRSFADSLASAGSTALDAAGHLRYGVSTDEKERLAASGALPGAPQDRSEDQAVANRYAAGYLFGQQWPRAAPVIQPLVDRVKTSGLWALGGESPETQSWAGHGVAMSKQPTPGTLGALTMGGRR